MGSPRDGLAPGCRRACGPAVLLLMCASLIGCASLQPRGVGPVAAPAAGDPDAAPSLRALPEIPSGAISDGPRTHQGLLLARETLDTPLPPAPADRSYASLQRWVDTVVADWVEHRRAQTEAIRDRFLLEGEPNQSELIVSHAVVGLIEEDTALWLARIPSPSELDDEPEIAGMFRDIARAQAEAFLSSALVDLRECADMAYRGSDELRHFAAYCHARHDRLREQMLAHSKTAPLLAGASAQ
jgi:hypothetical protein